MDKAPHLEFAPPPPPGAGRALFLALFIHGLLVLALTWGVHWQDQTQDLSVEAELWAAVPQTAAPKAQPVPDPVPPEPVKPTPEPKPVPPPPPVKEVSPTKPTVDPQIAIDKQKKKEAKLKEDKLKEDKLKEEKKLKEKKEAEEKALAQEKAEQEAQLVKLRQETLDRINKGLANATGTYTDKGKEVKAAGFSNNYLGRLGQKVKDAIVFPDLQNVVGNPTIVVEVSCNPDGQIVFPVKMLKSSGNVAWDAAVLLAIEKTEKFDPDKDTGKVPPKITFSFRPRD